MGSVGLRDGRTLGFDEYGQPEGAPILFFHGFPGSGRDYRLVDSGEIARAAGVRVIAPDRPGIGGSEVRPGRTLLDWPDDVACLVDALGIDRFAVVGLSGGGPFALACAHRLDNRVTRTGVVSGMGPADAPGMADGVSWTIPGKPALARRLILAMMRMGIRKDPDRVLAQSKGTFPPVDRAVLDDDEVGERFIDGLRAALSPSTSGALHDAAIYRQPWGFRPEDISVPVTLWHGGDDLNVPISVARWLADRIPTCTPHFLDGEGHLSLARGRWRDILDALAQT